MGQAEDEMAGWHAASMGMEFGWAPEVGDGSGRSGRAGSCGRKEWDMTEKATELK